MKRSGNPKIKLLAATSMVIFSLAAAFSGAYAWFDSNSKVAQDADTMKVEVLDGNFSSLKIYNSTYADGTDYRFSSTPSQTVTVSNWKDFTLAGLVPMKMNTYSSLNPYQPIMMVIDYREPIAVDSSTVVKITGISDKDYYVGNTREDAEKKLQTDGNPLSSVIHSYSFSFTDDVQLASTYGGESCFEFKVKTPQGESKAGLDQAQHSSFVTFTTEGLDTIGTFNSRCDFFDSSKKSGSYSVKQVAIIIDYYQDAMEDIYSEYLGEEVLEGAVIEGEASGDPVIRFRCDWSMTL